MVSHISLTFTVRTSKPATFIILFTVQTHLHKKRVLFYLSLTSTPNPAPVVHASSWPNEMQVEHQLRICVYSCRHASPFGQGMSTVLGSNCAISR